MSASSSRTTIPPTPSNGLQTKSQLVPTNTVSTSDGITVRARIDPTLTVDDVIKQLCVNLKIKEYPSHLALRDDSDDLVTNENLRKKIRAKVHLKCVEPYRFSRRLILYIPRLVSSPAREARETAERLQSASDKRKTLFSLQRYIRVSYYDIIVVRN
jgi:engulfment/cell motility protein 1